MKMKENDIINANKEANMSNCAYKVEEEHSSFLRFPFPFNLAKNGAHLNIIKKGLV
jgi:hypothetical protein